MRNLIDIILADERLSFALAVAVSLHIVVIFGISFTADTGSAVRQSLDVTIAVFEDDIKVEKPDFLAQNNQQGSGTLEEKAVPSVVDKSKWQDIAEESEISALPDASVVEHINNQVLATTSSNSDKTDAQKEADNSSSSELDTNWQDLVAQISRIEAILENERQEYAARPRILRLHSASTMSAKEASYIDAWRRKIEFIGNNNYPAEASRNKIYGKVMFKIVIGRDGSLLDADIVQSSGFKILDRAVTNIAHLAAPFAPFPPEIADFDRLELIRTFCFAPGNKIKDCDK